MRPCLRFPALLFASIAISSLGLAVPADAQQTGPALSWTMQESGTTAGLRGIYSVDGQVAWASGTEGTVLRTTDGGQHWIRCATPDAATDGATLDFRGIQAWDAQTAIVMASGPGEKSRLYKTVDGCRTWELVFKNPDAPDGFFDSFWMLPQYDVGIVLGDPVRRQVTILETQDSGKTWQKDSAKQLRIGNEAIGGFAASNQLLEQVRSGYMYGFVVGGKDGAWFYSRVSRFNHWERRSIPISSENESSGPFAMGYAWNPRTCSDCIRESPFAVIVGGDYTKANESKRTAAYSLDGGLHWTAAATPPHGYRSTVQYSADLKAWITAGTNGSDISHDDGKTWQPIDDGNWNALSLPFLVGPKGRIARLSVAPAAR